MNERMKIWILNHYNSTPAYGSLTRHYNLGKCLMELGHEVAVFSANRVHNSGAVFDTNGKRFEEYDDEIVPFVYVRTTPYDKNGVKRYINLISYYWNVKYAARHYEKEHGKPDIIYASSLQPLALNAGLELARKYGVKCICEVRDLFPEFLVKDNKITYQSIPGRILFGWEKRVYTKADELIFTMEGGAKYIQDKKWDKAQGGPVDLQNVHHINNGIDIAMFDQQRDTFCYPDPDLDQTGLRCVSFTGSVRKDYGLGILIEAAECLKECQNIKLLIWGTGNCTEELNREIEKRQLKNIILKGYVDKKYIPSVVSRSYLNLATLKDSYLYKYGVSQNKLFDYLAAGRPVLFSIKPGFSFIEANGAGMELEAATAVDIAKAIRYFAELPEADYDEYCACARKTAEKYDFHILTDRLLHEVIKVER